MTRSLTDILSSFPRCRIGVLGDLMLDRYCWGQATRISQEAPVPVVLVKRSTHVPGGAANVARNVLSLRGKVSVFGCVADDEDGRILVSLLKDGGADTTGVYEVEGGHTTVKTRVLAGNQQVLRVDREFPEEITEKLRGRILSKLEASLKAGELDALVMEDYAKGVFTKEFMERAVELATHYGVLSTLDPHPAHGFDVKGLTLMTPNRMEAFSLAGVAFEAGIGDPAHDLPLKHVGDVLMGKWNAEMLLVTLGAEGMALFRKERSKPLVIPTQARQVFDVSGAGDTVMATMTLAICAGAPAAQAASLANSAAGVVVGYVGTRAIEADELREVVKGR